MAGSTSSQAGSTAGAMIAKATARDGLDAAAAPGGRAFPAARRGVPVAGGTTPMDDGVSEPRQGARRRGCGRARIAGEASGCSRASSTSRGTPRGRRAARSFPRSLHACLCRQGRLASMASCGWCAAPAWAARWRAWAKCSRRSWPGSPLRIVFDSPAKTRGEIAVAIERGTIINIDNFQELERVDAGCRRPSGRAPVIGMRVNPQVGVGTIAAMSTATRTSKFGIAPGRPRQPRADPRGLSRTTMAHRPCTSMWARRDARWS